MVGTTIIEMALFGVLNVHLFDGNPDELLFDHLAGLAIGIQIFLIEFVALTHMFIFLYFCAVSYEHYSISCDDPAMIDAEHKKRAHKDKCAAAERKKKKQLEELEKTKEASDLTGDNEEPLL